MEISDHTINQVYKSAAEINGLQPHNAYEMLTNEMKVQSFKTGVEE